jgi:hypothetical protein
MPPQSTFEEYHDHFTLKGKRIRWHKAKRKTDPTTRRPFPLPKGSRKAVITEKIQAIKEKSIKKVKLFEDDRIYFVVRFTLALKSSLIRKAMQNIKADITYVYDDAHAVKFAVKRDYYNDFVKAIQENRYLISDITESYKEQKIDASLNKAIDQQQSQA